MRTKLLALLLLALPLSAISQNVAAQNTPVGTWTDPDGGTIEPVDPGTFTPADTVTAGSEGQSTVLTFEASGEARLGEGTCGPDGRWTLDGVTSAPNHPNCLAYRKSGEVGNNDKGSCIE